MRSWSYTVERTVGGINTDLHAKAKDMGRCLRGRAEVLYETLIKPQKPSFEELSVFLIRSLGTIMMSTMHART